MTPPPKPLGRKAYGSIPHLPGSKFGNRNDRGVPEGEDALYLERANPGDRVVVQEKLDGSCVAVCNVGGKIIPLIRNGRPAACSQWRHHRMFARWVRQQQDRFALLLGDGDHCAGEWLAMAHGTRYDISNRQPFVIFDYFQQNKRLPSHGAEARATKYGFAFVPVLYSGPDALPLQNALDLLGEYGHYGAIDPAEGVIYRRTIPDGRIFLAKYVRPEAEPCRYLTEDDDPDKAVWNWTP